MSLDSNCSPVTRHLTFVLKCSASPAALAAGPTNISIYRSTEIAKTGIIPINDGAATKALINETMGDHTPGYCAGHQKTVCGR